MSQPIDLDTTLTALGRDLRSIPVDEALAVVDAWYSQLKDTPLGEDLRKLKAVIESNNQADLANRLISLSADTGAASSEVGDDEVTATKIQDLAALLSEAGKALK